MRIGLIAPPWLPVPPRRYGGTENMIDGLARGLQAAGHDVILAASTGSRCPVPTVHIRVGQYDQMGSATIEAPYVLAAYDEFAGEVDVIHDHTQLGFLIAGDRGIPTLTTNHNLFDPDRRRIYAEAASRHIGVVAISKHHASTAAGIPLAGIVHNGIDVDAVPVGDGQGSHWRSGPYAAVLARMHPGKGIVEAIQIAKLAGVPLLVAAKMQSVAEKQYFDAEVRPVLDTYPDAEYVGEVSARGKYELLGGAVALLNPLQWDEPFGLSMIEALATGTPVLATLRGAAPEIVTHGVTGRFRNHWSQLAGDLERVHGIDRAACRQAVVDRFSIDRMAAEYADLYARSDRRELALAGAGGRA